MNYAVQILKITPKKLLTFDCDMRMVVKAVKELPSFVDFCRPFPSFVDLFQVRRFLWSVKNLPPFKNFILAHYFSSFWKMID